MELREDARSNTTNRGGSMNIDREIKFIDYDTNIYLVVAKRVGGGPWVVVDTTDEDTLDEFTSAESRVSAELFKQAADECDRLNAVETKPKVRKFQEAGSPRNDPDYWIIDGGEAFFIEGDGRRVDSIYSVSELLGNVQCDEKFYEITDD
jgi:hypothetical protein